MTERLTTAAASLFDGRFYELAELHGTKGVKYDAWDLINRCEACAPVALPEFDKGEDNQTSKLLSDRDFVSTLLLESQLYGFRKNMTGATQRNAATSLVFLQKTVDLDAVIRLTDDICSLHRHFLETAQLPHDSADRPKQLQKLLPLLEEVTKDDRGRAMTQIMVGNILRYRTAIVHHDISPAQGDAKELKKIAEHINEVTHSLGLDKEHDDPKWPHAARLLGCIHKEALYLADEYARTDTPPHTTVALGETALARTVYTAAC